MQMLELAESLVATVVASNQLKLKEREVILNKAGVATLKLKLGKEEQEHGTYPKRIRGWGSY